MSCFLHFIPARDLANRHYGTYKDVISRVQWLQSHMSSYRQIPVQDDGPAVVDTALAEGESLEAALVEYSYFPRIVRRLKQRWPGAVVAVRAINIEPLQHFDNTGWQCERGALWMLYGMARLLCHDLTVKRTADAILSINAWEKRVYWDRLPGRTRVVWLPYRCPDHLLPESPLPYPQRRTVACLPTSDNNRKSWDLVVRFQRFATEMKRLGSRDSYIVTGKVQGWGFPDCPAVTYTGFVDRLPDLMGTCRAVAVLSPLGYGFKTTLADAAASGAHVVVHPTLIRRSPRMVQSHLIPFDPGDPLSHESVQRALDHPPRGVVLHDALCQTAEDVLEDLFGTIRERGKELAQRSTTVQARRRGDVNPEPAPGSACK